MKIDKFLKQTAVYWGGPVNNGFGGFIFDSQYPIELDVRWEDKQELFLDGQGQQSLSRAVVYTNIDIDINGYMLLGELTDLNSDGDPQKHEGAMRIMAFSKIPDLKAQNFVR